MGKRRSAAKVVVKRRQLMGKTFDCPFCDHQGTIEVKIDLKQKIGTMKCRVCDSSDYTTTIRPADGPTDVFHEFIDSVHEVNEQPADDDRRGMSEPSSVTGGGARGMERDILGIYEQEQENQAQEEDEELEEEGLDLTELDQGPPRKKQKTERKRAKDEEQEVAGYDDEEGADGEMFKDAEGDNDLLPGEGEDPDADLELAGRVDDLGSESD